MTLRPLLFLVSSLALSLLFLGLVRWIPEEATRRAAHSRQGEEAKAFLHLHSQEIEGARWRLAQWEQRTGGSVETRLVDTVTRFQRRRDDFRLVGLIQAPEGILMEAECRSQAAVEFLLFCDRELPDLVPARFFLGCPPGTRVGSLRAEISFRPWTQTEGLPLSSALPAPEAPPPLTTLHVRPSDLRVRP
ncbi:hypothetical protein [Methylacidimicrobium sp. B4]|uniref:hypothetical protein n=1 Tax=Methylacidimicrobium sp. B4 TaxID=2796139 RepID=UPI001A8E276B|nr:hypothetical protein [Methylacidimicrobium sp. B4]QSR84999.1 hypothetical protein MacB4_01635 [Methylacidimicrobium sp. B4]